MKKGAILPIIILLLLVLIPTLYIFGPRFLIVYTTNNILRDKNQKAVNSNLVELKIPKFDDSSDLEQLKFCSLEFKNVFNNLTSSKDMSKDGYCTQILYFENGLSLTIIDWGKDLDFTRLVQNADPTITKKVQEFLNIDKTENYVILTRIFETQPATMNLLKTKGELHATSILAILKGGLVDAHKVNSDKIYFFETENLKGFQFSEPGSSERLDLQILKSARTIDIGFRGNVTQEQINRFLNTLKVG